MTSRSTAVAALAIVLGLGFGTTTSLVRGQADQTAPFVTELRARGFSLIPAPQEVELGAGNVVVDESWAVRSELGQENIAVRRLVQGASELHGLTFNGTNGEEIVLTVQPGAVQGTDDPALAEQAYLLQVTPEGIEIRGNGAAGLFYGVQSLLQLLRRDTAGRLVVPEGEIRDWPSLQLRFVHWDTKHHQKRIDTLKRLIDWHAFFKVNMIAFEMEDKYEYPSHPVIGAPGAYTKAEMQELTRYALDRHIQIVPVIQAPAHMTYVLKHEELAHLRSDGSNYQACMCDPQAIDLIFDMYQDMIDATPGVDYFYVSTDEVYYAGICSKCGRPYNDENRSLAWAEFAVKAHDWLAKRDRRMLAWVEYPLLPKHIAMLPKDLIDGIMGGRDEAFIAQEKQIGIRQLAYNPTQGAELLFPNYFATEYRGRQREGHLDAISRAVRETRDAGAELIGTFTAAWDDSGLHEETFRLGWATGAQYGWTPDGPTLEQSVADFMDVFYGPNSPDMIRVYKLLMEGARFFEEGWDEVTSTERGTGYGNSFGKGIGADRTDKVLALPEIPAPDTLHLEGTFGERYEALLAEAKDMKVDNDELVGRLTRYVGEVERNRYNLEVFLSIAYLERYFIRTVLTLADAEQSLLRASAAAAEDKPSDAVAALTAARDQVGDLIARRDWMWENLTTTWEKSRYEKNRTVDGNAFVHVMDDVKDHWADRRKGLDYMIAPFQRMDLRGWHAQLTERLDQYASHHKVRL